MPPIGVPSAVRVMRPWYLPGWVHDTSRGPAMGWLCQRPSAADGHAAVDALAVFMATDMAIGLPPQVRQPADHASEFIRGSGSPARNVMHPCQGDTRMMHVAERVLLPLPVSGGGRGLG